jgi:hypothetical protein
MGSLRGLAWSGFTGCPGCQWAAIISGRTVRNHVSIRPQLALGRLPVPSELAMEQGLAAAQRGSEWLPGCQVAANQVDVRA